MRLISGISFLLLFATRLVAADGASSPGKDAAPAADAGGRPKKRPAERLDLNQVDLEQLEEDWESTPSRPSVDVNNSVRIREIVEPTSEYSYASFGRPDPFSMPEFLMPSAMDPHAPEGKEIKIISPLQRYPLSDLNVRGVWQLASGEIRAVVSTPKNEGVVVKEGDPISSGKVLSIKRDQLVVRLYRLRADGVREYEDNTVPIGVKSQGAQGVIKLEPGKDPVFLLPEDKKKVTAPASPGLSVPSPVAPASILPVARPPAVPMPGSATSPQGAVPLPPGSVMMPQGNGAMLQGIPLPPGTMPAGALPIPASHDPE